MTSNIKNIHRFFSKVLFIVLTSLCLTTTLSSQDLSPEELLSELIQYKSTSGSEKEYGMYLEHFSYHKGLYSHVFTDDSSNFNIGISLYPISSGKPSVVFFNHLDVVHEGESDRWRYEPYCGVIDSVCIWGRGAIDCKGLAVMQLFGLIEYKKTLTEELPFNVVVLCVSGEESGGKNGAYTISENHLKELNPMVVYGEGGSGMKNVLPSYPDRPVFGVSIAEKQALWLKLTAKQKAAGHGAAPPELYANKKLIRSLIHILDRTDPIVFTKETRRMFRELGKTNGGFNGFVIKHINFDIFWPFVKHYFREGAPFHAFTHNTVVITGLSNPTGDVNQITNEASAYLDCRLLPGTDPDKFIKRLDGVIVHKLNVEIMESSPIAPSTKPDVYFDCMETALKKVHPESEAIPFLFPATTDNNYFRAKGIPVYGVIPIVFSNELIESVHNHNERIYIEDLHKGIDVYEVLIEEIRKQVK